MMAKIAGLEEELKVEQDKLQETQVCMCACMCVLSPSVLASSSAMSLVVRVVNHNFLLANVFVCQCGHSCSNLYTCVRETEEGWLSLPTLTCDHPYVRMVVCVSINHYAICFHRSLHIYHF